MLMPINIEDGEFLYTQLKTLIPNLSDRFADLAKYLFAGYSAKGWKYVFEKDSVEQVLEENTVGVYIFQSVASNIYTTILPYVSSNGDLSNGLSMFLTETKTYQITREENGSSSSSNDSTENHTRDNTDNITSNNCGMEENAPINASIESISSPTFKNKNTSSDESIRNEEFERTGNYSGNSSFNLTKTDTYTETSDKTANSPEYMKNYFEIRNYLIDCIKREVEKYVYECRLVY